MCCAVLPSCFCFALLVPIRSVDQSCIALLLSKLYTLAPEYRPADPGVYPPRSTYTIRAFEGVGGGGWGVEGGVCSKTRGTM